jgi:hypothetical protein
MLDGMRLATLTAAILAVLAVTPGPASAAAPCTRAAARTAILATPSLRSLRPILTQGGGVDTVICHDFTRDGATDMAATVFSGGTAGDIAWVVFRQTGGRWVLALKRPNVYKIGLFRLGSDLAESQPVYRANDPNCCPSGGFDHVRYHWNGTRFAIVRRWHTKRFHP